MLYLIASVFALSGDDRPTSEPRLLAPGAISTPSGEYSPVFHHARGELYFMRRTPGAFDYTIHVSRRSDGRWSDAAVAPFSGRHRDAAPHLSPDGATLYFDSSRPASGLEPGSINLWRVARTAQGWGAPALLRAASANPPPFPDAGADEFGPAVDADGQLYFYSFRRPDRGGARYRASDQAAAPVRDDAIGDPSAATFVSYLYLSPDGRTALMDGRSPGRSDGDMFFACRLASGAWSEPEPLASINTRSGEQAPSLSEDGALLFFASDRPVKDGRAGASNLYWMTTDGLPVPCGEEELRREG